MSKKKPRASAGPNGKQRLSVEVLQFGTPQAIKHYVANHWVPKTICFGSSRFADLPIPYSKLPGKIPMFVLHGKRVYLVLDPRTEGFVKRGGEFADVSEYLNPRGALAEIASIDDPLKLEIPPGSRGSLKLYGFEVIFKYENNKPEKKKINVKGESRGVFAPPPVDEPMERNAIWLAALAVFLMVGPILMWLMQAPIEKIENVSGLPQSILARVIAPVHYSLLPVVLDADPARNEEGVELTKMARFSPELGVWQAAFWVSELQRRWNAAEEGKPFDSEVEILRNVPTHDSRLERETTWNSVATERAKILTEMRTSPEASRYYKFQKEYPRFVVATAGGAAGSLLARLNRRLQGMEQVQMSMRALVRTQQAFLQDYYKNIIDFKIDMGSGLKAPGKVVFGPKPDEEFYRESAAFVQAAGLQTWAEELEGRWAQVDENEEMSGDGAGSTESVWMAESSVIEPLFSKISIGSIEGIEDNIVTNAKYSLAEKAIPPAPPPVARINREAVIAVLTSHKEELIACYESALREDPNLSGVTRWRWTIDELGRAREPRMLTSQIQNREFLFCVKARLASWQFPRPLNGRVAFEFPFEFNARK